MQNQNSRNLVEDLLTYHINGKNFDLDYGIISTQLMNKSGLIYTSLQFGYGKFHIDIQIFNQNFITVKLNKNLGEVHFSVKEVKQFLDRLESTIPPRVKVA